MAHIIIMDLRAQMSGLLLLDELASNTLSELMRLIRNVIKKFDFIWFNLTQKKFKVLV